MQFDFWRSKRDDCSTTKKMLSVYMDGHLSHDKKREVEQHLKTCRNCRQELESLQATVALLHRLPEVESPRSFALAAAGPVRKRSALPALRYATAAVALLVVLTFAADWSNLFGAAAPSANSRGEALYWLVPGQSENVTDDSKSSPVYLLVRGSGDNVYESIKGSSEDTPSFVTGEEPNKVLRLAPEGSDSTVLYSFDLDNSVAVETKKGDSKLNLAIGLQTGEAGEVACWLVPGQSENVTDDSKSSPVHLVVPGSGDSVYEALPEGTLSSGSQTEPNGVLRLVPGGSADTVIYSFNLVNSVAVETTGDGDLNRAIGLQTGEVLVKRNHWLRPLEYSLIGLVTVLGIATVLLWIREKRSVKDRRVII